MPLHFAAAMCTHQSAATGLPARCGASLQPTLLSPVLPCLVLLSRACREINYFVNKPSWSKAPESESHPGMIQLLHVSGCYPYCPACCLYRTACWQCLQLLESSAALPAFAATYPRHLISASAGSQRHCAPWAADLPHGRQRGRQDHAAGCGGWAQDAGSHRGGRRCRAMMAGFAQAGLNAGLDKSKSRRGHHTFSPSALVLPHRGRSG